MKKSIIISTYLLLAACGPNPDQSSSDPLKDQSSEVVSERQLQANGCSFVHTYETQLDCEFKKNPQDQYKQWVSVVRYKMSVDNVDIESFSDMTPVELSGKNIAAMGFLFAGTNSNADWSDEQSQYQAETRDLRAHDIQAYTLRHLFSSLKLMASVSQIFVEFSEDSVRVNTRDAENIEFAQNHLRLFKNLFLNEGLNGPQSSLKTRAIITALEDSLGEQ